MARPNRRPTREEKGSYDDNEEAAQEVSSPGVRIHLGSPELLKCTWEGLGRNCGALMLRHAGCSNSRIALASMFITPRICSGIDTWSDLFSRNRARLNVCCPAISSCKTCSAFSAGSFTARRSIALI